MASCQKLGQAGISGAWNADLLGQFSPVSGDPEILQMKQKGMSSRTPDIGPSHSPNEKPHLTSESHAVSVLGSRVITPVIECNHLRFARYLTPILKFKLPATRLRPTAPRFTSASWALSVQVDYFRSTSTGNRCGASLE